MELSGHVTLGDIILAASFLLGGMAAYARFTQRIAVVETKVKDIDVRLTDLHDWFLGTRSRRQQIGRELDARERREANGG